MDDAKERPRDANEGEGSRTADERDRQDATDFARRGDPLRKAIEAEREVENYRDEYEHAEKSGRSRSAGDAEADRSALPTRERALGTPPALPFGSADSRLRPR